MIYFSMKVDTFHRPFTAGDLASKHGIYNQCGSQFRTTFTKFQIEENKNVKNPPMDGMTRTHARTP